MVEPKPVEIVCSACGADTLLMRKPKYDGFTKVGETLTCTACGHVYAKEEDVPFKGKNTIKVFSDSDRSEQVKVFKEDENARLCRHCANYVVNPFMQWCARHKKEVEATDTCPQFTKRKTPESSDTKPGNDPEPTKRLI